MMIPFIVESDFIVSEDERQHVESLIELAYLECKPLVLPSGWRVSAVRGKDWSMQAKEATA